jgi:hypothetical protein
MRLPQVADIVIDAARFTPARHRPKMAYQNSKTEDGEDSLERQGILVRNHPAAQLGKGKIQMARYRWKG